MKTKRTNTKSTLVQRTGLLVSAAGLTPTTKYQPASAHRIMNPTSISDLMVNSFGSVVALVIVPRVENRTGLDSEFHCNSKSDDDDALSYAERKRYRTRQRSRENSDIEVTSNTR